MEEKFVLNSVDGLISWLNYRQTSGHRAGRYEAEQEERWAHLVEDLILELNEQKELTKDLKWRIARARSELSL